ncbi:MAG: hypothetical protein CVU50_10420 [Candidatus Cloacimonetes bacterium HGW-Cloacimonetes-3]|jgi:hypothetical protein|nr:MAG: hypothetical protein CVU50_10420 [Candidatus Cloacimonetes bacterium HGW-Cloacimonetes-3]
MNRIAISLILALFLCSLSAQDNGLQSLIDSMLKSRPDYQQVINRYEREKAINKIDKSLGWFDVNLNMQRYDNDFTRDETVNSLEHSIVEETDKRWSIDLNKQLFPKDFDSTTDKIDARVNLLRYRQSTKLAYLSASDDIMEDMIDWYKSDRMVALLQSSLEILHMQNKTLEELAEQNQPNMDMMIEVLEDINNKEGDLERYSSAVALYNNQYGEVLPRFLDSIREFMATSTPADTLSLYQRADSECKVIEKETAKINKKIRLNHSYFFLPELNLSLSYNWRENRQNWDIEQNNSFKSMMRNQDEMYPEARIELSLPFDLFNNTKGKLSLLKAYEKDVSIRSMEMQRDWQQLVLNRLTGYRSASQDLKRKATLNDYHNHNLSLQTLKMQEEPALLGFNPELSLHQTALKYEDAKLKLEIAEMKLYKEIYLINILKEVAK